MTEPIKTAGVVCLKANQVLLIKPGTESQHIEDVLGLPAGRVEGEETLREAAIRELFEETGIELEGEQIHRLPKEYTAVLDRRDGTEVSMRWVVFAVDNMGEEPKETPEGIPVWTDIDSLKELKLQKNVFAAIKQAIKELR